MKYELTIEYSDGTRKRIPQEFDSIPEADDYAYSDGDHVVSYEIREIK